MQALIGMSHVPFAYFVLNLDPILLRIGPFAIHWYGVAYVVAIAIALMVILRWARREGFHEDQVWGLFIWAAIGGLVGGRLYFVVQQPDLVEKYLLNPINIIAVWNGGMAFFGAIFVGAGMLFLLAPRYGLSRWIALDGGALFAAVGQIFGRFGNVVNGDILGKVAGGPVSLPPGTCATAPCFTYVADPHILPWALVYLNSNNPFVQTGIPFQPAQVYEILFNLVALALLWPLRYRLPKLRAGLFFMLYLVFYTISQFVVFFFRATEPATPFLGISGLKQAQWTAIIVFLLCVPLTLLVVKVSRPWPFSDKRPVPWPNFAPVDVPSPAQEPPVDVPVAPPARQRASTPSAPSLDDLPPWQPTRPTGGRLRNLFGDMAHLSSGQ
ncbi:MAG TPA: prolipoprotein diacylglyceryl transferase, partial [Ktedonobacterales bacterium]|nr:prolipoprotein diacylglyceryl transferase [Ktedonobacterales bacterium]